jgi:predicted GTPase
MTILWRHWREATLAALLALPWLSLLVLGGVWLWQNEAGLVWGLAIAVLGLCAWPIYRSLGRETPEEALIEVAALAQATQGWDKSATEAFAAVRAIAETVPALALDDTGHVSSQALSLAKRTIDAVAKCYHAEQSHGWAHFTLPEALLLAEQLSATLRREALRTIPGARVLRLDHLLRLRDGHERIGATTKFVARAGWRLARVGQLLFSPGSGLAAEAKRLVLDQTGAVLSSRLRRQAARLFVLELGRAAIDLYSGRLSLSPAELAAAGAAELPAEPNPDVPLRVMLLGQVNAGKTSTLNAMAGEVRGEQGVLPERGEGTSHVIRVDGRPALVLTDLPGLGTGPDDAATLARRVTQADMLLWVVSATQPARAPDMAAISALRAAFTAMLDRRPPPILVVLTHIDQLRPAGEWDPPYDIVNPVRPKARMIAQAAMAAAEAFGVEPGHVIPVALTSGRAPTNIDQLWGRIAASLDEGRQRQLERLRAERSGLSLRELTEQVSRSARLLAKLATKGSD